MTAIVINHIPAVRPLDQHAPSAVKGGNAGWLYGWIRAYLPPSNRGGFDGVINVYQTNYFNIAGQINNQVSVIDVKNSAANASINVNANQHALNLKSAELAVH